MPVVVQWITRILPARYYVSIMRNVFLKGTSVGFLTSDIAALGIIATVLIIRATRAFQKRLE
jgi:ABC-2 type transport system permease protein